MARLSKIPNGVEEASDPEYRCAASDRSDSATSVSTEPFSGDPDALTSEEEEDFGVGIKRRVKSLGRGTKHSVKRALLHLDKSTKSSQHHDKEASIYLNSHPAFNPRKIVKEEPITLSRSLDTVAGAATSAARVIAHPKQAFKQGVAKKFAIHDQSLPSKQTDAALLRAYDELNQAEVSQSNDSRSGVDIERLRSEVDGLDEQRESLRVAWTTERFVHRVRAVPVQAYRHPESSEYWISGADGRKEFQRLRYWLHMFRYWNQSFSLQYIDDFDEPPFQRDTLLLHLERCIKASDPWQAWLMRLRTISRWEDPKQTALWFATWVFIWYLNRVISFILLYVIYIVFKNRFGRPSTKEALRESHARAFDRTAKAYKFSEMVNRHGQKEWLDPLVEASGPFFQTQAGDIADHLEILINFCEWKNPAMTWATIVFTAVVILLGNATSTDWSMRILNLIIILYFFLSRPIASIHPKYRHTVSPVKWIFWGIPTHAEWSFEYLSNQSELVRERLAGQRLEQQLAGGAEKNGPLHDTVDSAIHEFACLFHGHRGDLVISLDAFYFRRRSSQKILWRYPYTDLAEMWKIEQSLMKSTMKVQRPLALRLLLRDGSLATLNGMKSRDEAFNVMLGFSGLRWKVEVMPRTDELKGFGTGEAEPGDDEAFDSGDDSDCVFYDTHSSISVLA